MFVDESGFYPLAAVATTWAPIGQTPVLREWQTRTHLSVISGVTKDGRCSFAIHEKAINGEWAARFLKQLLRTIDSRLLVIWDGSPIHRSGPVKELLAASQGRLWLERLPGYAPELNPDEGVWKHLKRTELANVCSPDLPTHRQELLNAIRRFRRRSRELIPEFFNHAKL